MHSRGSEWRVWDLHVHTPDSYEEEYTFCDEAERVKYGGDIWAKYLDALEKVEGVAVVGITDYFGIEGFRKVLAARNDGRLSNLGLLLPNIEFRDKVITGETRRLNFHILFSELVDLREIDTILGGIRLPLSSPGEQRPQYVPCTRDGLIKVGRRFHNDDLMPAEQAYVEGCKYATVDVSQVVTLLQETPGLEGKYLIVGVEDSRGGASEISWDQSGMIRLEMYQRCDLIDSGTEATILFWSGRSDRITPQQLTARFGGPKACIHGSDAHRFDSLCKPDLDKRCWIKADTTFLGLRQVMYEPIERVRIQSGNPEPSKSIFCLSSLTISNGKVNTELEIASDCVPLNQNLVVVTGGKGSGKTALVDLAANCFVDRRGTAGGGNSFVSRIEDEKPDMKTELGFSGGNVDPFRKAVSDATYFEASEVTYLPQGEIEKICEDRDRLNNRIWEVVFGNPAVARAGFKGRFAAMKTEIAGAVDGLRRLNSQIVELEKETSPSIVQEAERQKILKEGGLKDKRNEVSILLVSVGSQEAQRVEALKLEQTGLRARLAKMEGILSGWEDMWEDWERSAARINAAVASINGAVQELGLNGSIPELSLAEQRRSALEIESRVREASVAASARLSEVSHPLDALEGRERQHAELLETVELLEAELVAIDARLSDLRTKQDELTILKGRRIEAYASVLNRHIELRQLYEQAIGLFSSGRQETLSNVNFVATVYFDHDRFVRGGLDILDLRTINEAQIRNHGKRISDLMAAGNYVDDEKLRAVVESLLALRGQMRRSSGASALFDWVFDNYCSLNTRVLFRGRPLQKLSLGEKGMVLLKLVLAQGDEPLIIDQPEENLDNRYIYTELVNAIREGKKHRQIIMATNNGNLVVNADAEQVIAAEFENNIIKYSSGSLENPDIREFIIPVLEGGEEAFRRRESKYGLTLSKHAAS